jgi:hypothetical protein
MTDIFYCASRSRRGRVVLDGARRSDLTGFGSDQKPGRAPSLLLEVR